MQVDRSFTNDYGTQRSQKRLFTIRLYEWRLLDDEITMVEE
jgi:hypothetical protein